MNKHNKIISICSWCAKSKVKEKENKAKKMGYRITHGMCGKPNCPGTIAWN